MADDEKTSSTTAGAEVATEAADAAEAATDTNAANDANAANAANATSAPTSLLEATLELVELGGVTEESEAFIEEKKADSEDFIEVPLGDTNNNENDEKEQEKAVPDSKPTADPSSFEVAKDAKDAKSTSASVSKDSTNTKSENVPTTPTTTTPTSPTTPPLTQSREDSASPLSSWLILYLTPLLQLGATKILDPSDVGPPSSIDRSEYCYANVKREWEGELERVRVKNERGRMAHGSKVEKARRKGDHKLIRKLGEYKPVTPNFAKVLWNAFGYYKVLLAVFLYVLSSLLQFLPVLILNDLVRYFELGAPPGYRALLGHPWGDVIGLFLFPLLVSLFQTRSQVILNHCAVFVRTAVSTLLYQKALTISAAGRAQTSTGQVVNIMSNDTSQLQRFLQFFGMVLIAPIQIIIALILIYRQVGNATWVGIGFMLMLVPVNGVVFANVSKMRRKVLKYSDSRVKMINEILSGIRIIKFYAWEEPFGKEVQRLRDKELKALTRLAYVSAVGFSLIMLSAPIINPILVFFAYVNMKGVDGGENQLTAATAFTTIALFNVIRFPFAFLPMGFLQYIQSKIALRRISRYLELSELTSYVDTDPNNPAILSITANAANAADAADAADSDAPTMDDDDTNDNNNGRSSTPSTPAILIQNGNFAWVDPDAIPPPPAEPKKKRGMSKGMSFRRSSSAAQNVQSAQSGQGGANAASGSGGAPGMARTMSRAESLASLNISVKTADSDDEPSRESRITLKDISCSIERGSLVAVVGSVGSGKSSLLSAILGEMESVDGGKVCMPLLPTGHDGSNNTGNTANTANTVSFCQQNPWVVNDTLRGNIIFGRPFDKERYDKVIAACALTDDLAVLPAGDMTEIGERGINLSGGQKARVALARAVYSTQTQLLLLDDPLSAVDAHVGEHLFSQAITGEVTKSGMGGMGKMGGNGRMTRVLVTHHVHFLPRCDKVIMMEKGSVSCMGTYAELVERGVNFSNAVEAGDKDDGDETKKETGEDGDKKEADKGTEEAGKSSDEKKEESHKEGDDKMKKAGKKLIKDEEQNEGSVAGSMYIHYARAGGVIAFFSIFFIQGVGRASEIMASFWLSIWAESSANPNNTRSTTFYLNVYAAFGLGGVLCLTARSLAMAVHRLHASKKLHNDLTKSILRAPVAFFDVTPIGRVLNRFAADMDKIDLELTQSLGQSVSTMASIFGAVAAIVAATKGTLLIALVPVGYVNYVLQKWFRKSSTELQRAASVANSPIFTDFSQMLSGTATIRAYGKQTMFFQNCQKSFNNFNALFTSIQQANFWLGLRLDVLGGLVGFIIGAIALGTADYNFIPAGWLGLALSYSIEVTGFLKHGVRMIATVEAEMNSVERVMYYSNNIDAEAAATTKNDPSPEKWPSQGEIKIQNASMRYRDGPLVLKKISVHIKGGEKIGVVGRTGSGKSSLMTALFRICELDSDGGKILIDGVDISQIGLSLLRQKLSIIPQDPVMFSNTVRYNLDPFGEKSEYELWEALKKVQLAEAIAVLPDGLDEQVAEGGENFSQGQRQLLCIARSLLRHPKILVMDEATASIDNTTDALIQQMIRENFASATILTIAHRLNTIMDSDRVLVLDDGNVAEFDSPSALLKSGGIFSSMVAKSKDAHSK